MANTQTYPVIYVRGFGGNTSGIDTATDDPFYGFNDGATHVRVDGDDKPQFYQFEGPLVRLMEDEDYRVPMHGGQQAYLSRSDDGSQPRASIWIYRFYDPAADTFGAATSSHSSGSSWPRPTLRTRRMAARRPRRCGSWRTQWAALSAAA